MTYDLAKFIKENSEIHEVVTSESRVCTICGKEGLNGYGMKGHFRRHLEEQCKHENTTLTLSIELLEVAWDCAPENHLIITRNCKDCSLTEFIHVNPDELNVSPEHIETLWNRNKKGRIRI